MGQMRYPAFLNGAILLALIGIRVDGTPLLGYIVGSEALQLTLVLGLVILQFFLVPMDKYSPAATAGFRFGQKLARLVRKD